MDTGAETDPDMDTGAETDPDMDTGAEADTGMDTVGDDEEAGPGRCGAPGPYDDGDRRAGRGRTVV
ncbi:hypothetical protein GTY84_25940 [Streptomyces sp. SID8352]|nr:hypothetical protein [Streptomyces sp. SID8352]